jgi:RNA polymerase sigma-70 factor (ECF subfamily)
MTKRRNLFTFHFSFVFVDTEILKICIAQQPRGWENFVDRFAGLIFHVIDHVYQARYQNLLPKQRESLCEMVFAAFQHDQYRLLKQYRGTSTVSSFLSVVTRRIVARHLNNECGEVT